MADSEDEYDRKRRDKFRGERGAGEAYRTERRERSSGTTGGRDEWVERNPFRAGSASGGAGGRPLRPDYRDFSRTARDRYGSPGREVPPAKRMRPDWVDEVRGGGGRYGAYDPYIMHAWNEHYAAAAHSMHAPYGHPHASHSREPNINNETLTQPPMLTLKQFLDTQDDGISDAEVLRKYSEYKLDFKRQQLNEFFVAHKDEEWFKNKYHPMDSVKRKEEQWNFLKKRVQVFSELFEKGLIKSVSIDTSQSEALLRLLDTVVIKLEGGTDDDLRVLDEKPKDITFSERVSIDNNKIKTTLDDDVIITSVSTRKTEESVNKVEPKLVSPNRMKDVDNEDNWDEEDAVKSEEKTNVVALDEIEKSTELVESQKIKEKKTLKRKRARSSSSTSSSSDSQTSSSSVSDDDDEKNKKLKEKYDLDCIKSEPSGAHENVVEDKTVSTSDITANLGNDVSVQHTKDNGDADSVNKTDQSPRTNETVLINNKKTSQVDFDSIASSSVITPVDGVIVDDKTNDKKANLDIAWEIDAEKGEIKKYANDETIDVDKEPKPRALHRTSSIFLRNLAPTITKEEIENACQRYEGYLRVAIADPLVERRWYRRGWVTFKRDVNIKEYCWNLNNIRLRDCEMGAIVNRDLSRRVRPVTGITAHKTIVRADIKLCAKIALNLDERSKLWVQVDNTAIHEVEQNNGNADNIVVNKGNRSSTYGFKSNNPVLQNITDFLIEEASAEEEELLGISGDLKEGETDGIERDPQLISVLDSLILYLRIVHSVDFYNHCEYPYEDEMPNRCGIIHARGPAPTKATQSDIHDYIRNFENKLQVFLAKSADVDEEELKNLGCKDAEVEVEKFIQANTQELAKDKWLCPLSGKKFKGPEFIRKHIFNKHEDKIDEVRKEVEFFNNYLRDPKRPQLPEHPGNTKRTNSELSSNVVSAGGGGGYRPPAMYPPAYIPSYAAYAPPIMMPGRGGRSFAGGRRELPIEHQRRIIGYHDLDAPANFDMFD